MSRERGRGERPRQAGGRRGRSASRGPVAEETVRIESIAAGGEGVGRLRDGRVVFVHRTAPGDLAAVGLVEQKARWARGRLLRVLEPSPVRREAPCPFYARCGGCTLEHMEYAAQLEAKRGIVTEALRRIGKVEAEVSPVTPSPRETRYRNRVSFALRRRGSGRVVAGFHAVGAPGEVIDIDGRCLLPEPAIARVWDRLRGAWGPDARMLPSGEELRLTLRATQSGAVSLLIEGGFAPGEPESLLRRVEGLEAVWHRPGSAPPELIAGSRALPETWGDETLALSGAAFLQVNRRAASLLEDHVLQLAGAVQGVRVVDAYCGAGLHARRLARAGAIVTGLELDRDAVAAARDAAPEGASFLEGRVEDLLGAALPADLVILNPPRAGVAVEVVEALQSRMPPRIIYISCGPATLARDIGRLGDMIEVAGLRAFDLFPQTAHVETVADLRRA